jgi:hypothetical protein
MRTLAFFFFVANAIVLSRVFRANILKNIYKKVKKIVGIG